ncbi:hypothetical protein [Spirosoma foliorum]|uniref:Uncharacterized protein n=1 Tax=Spirosoma foliorum TaxID=2710596 RepID=A0A7G5H567_9BACT|nr:hypothetical protein [Spirosoma foliorum]QMW06259.1 hypothetical protein H3H32_15920 [Spirosoma foliorum]
MLDTIRQTFPRTTTGNCLQTLTDTEFCIFDTDKKRCEIQLDPDGLKHFTVENPTSRAIHFLAIDKCIFSDGDHIQRCDCAVFDSKTFCFVEIKEIDSAAKRSEHYRKAKEQLKATIQHFQEQLEFTTKRIEAYACVGRTTARPAKPAADLNDRLEFEELGSALYHGNIKRFA